MAKKSETTGPVTEQAATAEPQASGNLTIAQLGQRMTKGRKAASAPTTATTTAASAKTATSSEQAEAADATTDLSQLETESSAALTDEAAETESNGGPQDDASSALPDGGEGEGAAATDETEAEPASKAVRDLQKRVGKLTEQRNEARAKNAELEERLARVEAGQTAQAAPPHPADRAMAGDRTVNELDGQLGGIEGFLKWADENAYGGTYTEGDKTYTLSEDEVKSYRRKSESERIRLNAKRETRLESLRVDFDNRRAAAHAEAVKLYPWVEQKSSPEFQDAIAVIRENPSVLERPDFELVVARQVAGQRLEREAKKKGLKPAANGRPATPVVTFSPTAAPKGNAKDATVSAAEKRFQDGGGRESDLSKLLAQRRLARLDAAKG